MSTFQLAQINVSRLNAPLDDPSVADFRGRKLLSFRVGTINDIRNNKVYGCGSDGKAPFELAGQVSFSGYPFLVNSTNVN